MPLASGARFIARMFEAVTRIPYSPHLFVFVPLVITCGRVAGEELLFGFEAALPELVLNYLVGYVMMHLLATGIFHVALGLDVERAAGAVSAGMPVAWVPPLIDLVLPAQPGRAYRYFYDFHWNFASSSQMIGETVSVWLTIAVTVAFAAWRSRSALRALAAGALLYLALQFYGWGWIAICDAVAGASGRVSAIELMTLSGTVIVGGLYAALHRRTLVPSLKRMNHAAPWGLIAAIGSRLIGEPWAVTALKGLVVAFSFQLVVVTNDYYDREQDGRQGGAARPVTGNDALFASFLMALLSAWALVHHPRAFFLIAAFFSLCALYHIPPLRFKRVFGLNYAIEGIAGAACFLFGCMRFSLAGSPGREALAVHSFPEGRWALLFAALVAGGFSAGAMFKDYKDIEQDRAEGVGTVYMVPSGWGVGAVTVHRLIAMSVTCMCLAPPIWLAVTGGVTIPVCLLFASAAVPGALLLLIKDKTTAVESTIWAIGAFFLLLLPQVPIMTAP